MHIAYILISYYTCIVSCCTAIICFTDLVQAKWNQLSWQYWNNLEKFTRTSHYSKAFCNDYNSKETCMHLDHCTIFKTLCYLNYFYKTTADNNSLCYLSVKCMKGIFQLTLLSICHSKILCSYTQNSWAVTQNFFLSHENKICATILLVCVMTSYCILFNFAIMWGVFQP